MSTEDEACSKYTITLVLSRTQFPPVTAQSTLHVLDDGLTKHFVLLNSPLLSDILQLIVC